MWTEIFLILVILAILGWILFSGGGTFRTRRLSGEISRLREEVGRLRSVNEALRGNLESARWERARLSADICNIVRDLERTKAAVAGSRACHETLLGRYGLEPGPELVDRILAASPRVDRATKLALSRAILVGEVGETVLKNLATGAKINRIAADAEIPITVARGQIKALQLLGYVNERLRPTDRGRELLT
jgi:outer membrane murein-binding lipoprotein Lpp